MKTGTLKKSRKHHHFWIEDECLYESYQTIRGLRYCSVMNVKGMEDVEHLSVEQVKEVESKYCIFDKQY